jgi:DNA polymerase-3 subunit gamma/tau
VQSHLATVLAEEGIAAEAGALRLIARAAHGSMRDALSLADQAIAHGAGAVLEAGVRQMLGAVDRGHALRLVEALAGRDGAAVVAAVDGLRVLGLSANGTLEELAALLQQMALAQAVPLALDSQDPQTPEVIRLAGLLAPDETQLLYSIVLHGRAELGLAPDEYSGLVMVLLRLLAFAPAGGPERRSPAAPESTTLTPPAPASPARASPASRPHEAGAPRIPNRTVRGRAPTARVVAASPEPPASTDTSGQAVLEREPATVRERTPSPAGSQPTSAPDAATDLVRTPLGDRWEQEVRALLEHNGVTALARELALQAQCVAIEGTQWTLRVERESLRAPAQREKLQAALREALGEPVTLRVELGAIDDTPARREAAESARRQQQAERIIHDDPLVQALMKQYSTARIVPGSVKPH